MERKDNNLQSSENGIEKVLSEVFVALVENGESQNTSMRLDFIQKIKGLTTTFYKKNDYKNNIQKKGLDILQLSESQGIDALIISCCRDDQHQFLKYTSEKAMKEHIVCCLLCNEFETKKDLLVDLKHVALYNNKVYDLLDSKNQSALVIDSSKIHKQQFHSFNSLVSILCANHSQLASQIPTLTHVIELIHFTFTIGSEKKQFSITAVEFPREALCSNPIPTVEEVFLTNEMTCLLDYLLCLRTNQVFLQRGLLTQYIQEKQTTKHFFSSTYCVISCSEEDLEALSASEEIPSPNTSLSSTFISQLVLLRKMEQTKTEELAKRLLFLHEKVEKLTNEQSSNKVEQIHLQKNIQELGICDKNQSFKEMVEVLIEKYKELKEMYEQTSQQIHSFLTPTESTTAITSTSSIQGLLNEAMKCVDSLEGQQDNQSFNCTIQQYINRLEKQVKEYEGKWKEFASIAQERNEYQMEYETLKKELEEKKEKEKEWNEKESTMKKNMALIHQQVQAYIQNMNEMKKHLEKDQEMIANMEVYLFSLREEVQSLVQMKSVINQLCEAIIEKMNQYSYTYGVFPEFYQLQVAMEELKTCLKEPEKLGDERWKAVLSSVQQEIKEDEFDSSNLSSCCQSPNSCRDSNIDMMNMDSSNICLQQLVVQYNQGIGNYYWLSKHMVDVQYELKVSEEAIHQLTVQLNVICKQKEEKMSQKEVLEEFVLRFNEELCILAEDITTEGDKLNGLSGIDAVLQEERVNSLISRLSDVNSMLLTRKQQIDTLMKEIQSLEESFTVQKRLLLALVRKEDKLKKMISAVKLRFKQQEDELCRIRRAMEIGIDHSHHEAIEAIESQQPNKAISLSQKQSSISLLLSIDITNEEEKKAIEKKLEEVNTHVATSYSLYQQVYQHFLENQKQLVRLTEDNSELRKKLFVLTNQKEIDDIKKQLEQNSQIIEELRKEQEEDMESSIHHYNDYLIWRITKNQLMKKEISWITQQKDQSSVLQEEEKENEEMIKKLDHCKEIIEKQFKKENENVQHDLQVHIQPIHEELEIALSEKEKVEKELKEIEEMKKRNLIDEYHDDYDDIVNQIKQLDSQYLNDSNNPDYQKQREVLEEKKQYVQGLFEEQLHREEVLPNKAEQLSERLKALHFQIDDLQVEIEKEKKNIVNEENFDDKLIHSIVGSLNNCKREIEKKEYQEGKIYSFALEEDYENFTALYKDASLLPIPCDSYQAQSTSQLIGYLLKKKENIILKDEEEEEEEEDTVVSKRMSTETVQMATVSKESIDCRLPARWMEDNESSFCMVCQKPFSLFRRRHHCRKCGKLVCDACSQNRANLAYLGYVDSVRVCNLCTYDCFLLINKL